MREKYYIIEVYSESENERIRVYQTDLGLVAWLMWWLIKTNTDCKYPIMTIRVG